jgi:hypothetical protein
MRTLAKTIAASVGLFGAAVALAVPASAESPEGSFTGTVTVTSGDIITPLGQTETFVFTSCGPDCLHKGDPADPAGTDRDFHRQGDTWIATWGGEGYSCTSTLTSSLVYIDDCPPPDSAHSEWQLTKTG